MNRCCRVAPVFSLVSINQIISINNFNFDKKNFIRNSIKKKLNCISFQKLELDQD